MGLPNFKIEPKGRVSEVFLALEIKRFYDATIYIGHLPYGRNSNGSSYEHVLIEGKGTCSTKHALLAALCQEQGIKEVQLYTGIYEMSEGNTPGVGSVLEKYNLESIPEAHCYLKYNNERYDFTRLDVTGEPVEIFLTEQQITPGQIGEYKKKFHRSYFPKWLEDKILGQIVSVEQLWRIREECIRKLSQ
ncbi:hypothetical protein IM538_06710 [Cytobacillus suaedae]|nr:hypothetical protein IM538_06710 [Cytobacillus suaedae]